jgi:diaminopimelate epimerase
MRFAFTKMHGLGNDFVVFDAISQSIALTADQVRFIADRRRGIGCDQVLLVSRPARSGVDFSYRIYNADGGEVEQCGNGARCFVRFVREKGLTDKAEIVVETAAGIIRPRMEADGEVCVDMGSPRFQPEAIPFVAERQALDYALRVGEDEYTIGAVSMGNPHAVLQVADVDSAPVAKLGPRIEAHERFPRRANVGFMQVVDRGHIRLRVYERGTGETLACGTGACAAVSVGRLWSLLDEWVDVSLPGGTLHVRWDGRAGHVWMKGPAQKVYEGYIEL